MKTLLDAGMLHGDCLTVTGRTLADDLEDVAPYPEGQRIIRPLADPIKPDSHLVVLYGNLAPTGAVAKITGHEGLAFTGRAKVYHGEEAAMAAIMDGSVQRGDVVVVRYEGTARRTGHARDAEPDQRHQRPGSLRGRGPHHRRTVLGGLPRFRHRAHHAGGLSKADPSRCSKTADEITIDAERRRIDVALSDEELARRRAAWTPPEPYARKGVLAKYARLVSSASERAVTDL